jgi:hypothetical protein
VPSVESLDLNIIRAEILDVAGSEAACGAKVLRKGGDAYVIAASSSPSCRTTGRGCRSASADTVIIAIIGSVRADASGAGGGCRVSGKSDNLGRTADFARFIGHRLAALTSTGGS